MIEEKILSFVTDALTSSCRQLDQISSLFFVGSRRLYIGTHISRYCNLIKQSKTLKIIDKSQHSLLFEELAEIGACLKTQCVFIFTLSLGLKLVTAGLENYDESIHENNDIKQVIKPKPIVIDLDDVDDCAPVNFKSNIVINATKWLNVLEYALENLKEDGFIKMCIAENSLSSFDTPQHEIELVRGMVKSIELFVTKWKDTHNTTNNQIEALTKAVAEVECSVTEKVQLKTKKKKNHKRDQPIVRTNPGMQVLATGLRAMLEAIKDY